MSSSMLQQNIVTYAIQIGIAVAVAAAIPFLLRLRAPKARLAYWQAVLAACLLLPAMRSWKRETLTATFQTESAIVRPAAPMPDPPILPLSNALPLLLLAGAAARFAWLLLGLRRLRVYRRESRPLEPSSALTEAWRAEAELRVTGSVSSPVTFGFFRPVVLLPARFTILDEPTREAILCHEILHVRRRDWLFTVLEESIRAALWFHPAIWWLLGEIQLSREQTVDREAVEMTKSRDGYVDALLTIAAGPVNFDLTPAPLFLRKRHLKQRVFSILKEVRMSRTKTISALAASMALLAVSCWFITGAVPLQAQPQVVADAEGVSVEMNGAELMHRAPVAYPVAAAAKGIQGTVVVQVKIADDGTVSDAAVLSGPDELRKGVLQSVLNWHFGRDAALTTRQVSVTFEVAKAAQAVSDRPPSNPVMLQGNFGSTIGTTPRVLRRIVTAGLTPRQSAQLLAQLPVHEGDSMSLLEAMQRVQQPVHAFDEHLRVSAMALSGDEIELSIATPEAPRPAGSAPPPPPPPPPPGYGAQSTQTQLKGIRVGANVAQANLIAQVPPAYPPLAKAARVQGTVKLAAVIGEDGSVKQLDLISGPPLLVLAATQAAQQWLYKPTLLNGQPVQVITTIDINFTLAQ